jgi:hypothetical protein
MGDPYVERIGAAMRPHVFAEAMPDIKLAKLGDLGGANRRRALLARRRRQEAAYS